jgi:hypothetical protein
VCGLVELNLTYTSVTIETLLRIVTQRSSLQLLVVAGAPGPFLPRHFLRLCCKHDPHAGSAGEDCTSDNAWFRQACS